MQVLDHGVQIEALELLSVVERLPHRIGQWRVLVQNFQVELIWPPTRIRRRSSHRVSARANLYRALGFGWTIWDSRRCRCEFFLHVLILLRTSLKKYRAERRLRRLTGSAPRSALRAEPPENEFAFAKNALTKGARGRPGHVVPRHILDIAAPVADEVMMPHVFRIEPGGTALDGHFTHQTRPHQVPQIVVGRG